MELHLRWHIRRAKNGVCPGGVTQNLPPQYRGVWAFQAPWYPSQAALWAYSGTGGGTPPGQTQFLRPRNL